MIRSPAVAAALLCLSAANADTVETQSGAWSQRAAELGVTAARVVIEYSLTDDCKLAKTRVVKNSARDIFDSDAIAAIVLFFVGPFQDSNRTIYWPTDLGHHYIRCEMNADGSLARATLTAGRYPAASPVADRRIDLRLSTLGSRTRTVNFSFRNGSLSWNATGD